MATNGTTVTMTAFDAMLKNVYIDKKNLYIMDAFQNKAITALPKATDATGRNWNVPIVDVSVAGTAGTYANARSNATAGNDLVFQGLWKDKFAALFLDEKTIRMSISKEGAVEPALMAKIDGVRRSFNQSVEYQAYRDEGGSVGQASTGSYPGGGNTTVTFTPNTGIAATQYLKIGHVLNYGTTSDGTSLAGGGTPNQLTVAKMNVNGTLQVTGTLATIQDFVAKQNQFVYIDGDAANAGTVATATGIPLAGFKSWVPTSDPTATDLFKGLNRSQDPRGLAGIRIDATNEKVEEAFLDGADVTARFGGETDLILTHPTTLTKLKKELSGQNRYLKDTTYSGKPGVRMTKDQAARFGFSGLALDANGSTVTIAGAWACQSNLSWMLTTKHWKLWTAGPFPDVRGRDGLTMLRQTDTSYVYELVGYGELVCYAPGMQGVLIHDNGL